MYSLVPTRQCALINRISFPLTFFLIHSLVDFMIELVHYQLITIPKYFLDMLFESESVSHSVMSDSLWPHGLYSLPGCFVHGVLQARILEWVAISFSRGSSQSRDQTQVSCIAGRFFIV